MAVALEQSSPAAPSQAEKRRRWHREVIGVLVGYGLYTLVRNQFGSGAGAGVTKDAFANALDVLRLEDALHILNEPHIQDATNALGIVPSLAAYYGVAHFVVTIGVAVWAYHRHGLAYKRFRFAMALSTVCAAITFALFPLMPPRLLANDGPLGGQELSEQVGARDYGFEDSSEIHNGPWSYEAGAVKGISNEYAAMPSLHFGWAVSCALVLVATRKRWLAALGVAHVTLTGWAVVATANHYWLDVVAGAVIAAVWAIVAVFVYRRPAPPALAAGEALERDEIDALEQELTGEVEGVLP